MGVHEMTAKDDNNVLRQYVSHVHARVCCRLQDYSRLLMCP